MARKQKYFNVLRVSREDIVLAFDGFDGEIALKARTMSLSNLEIRYLARKLVDALMSGCDYWQSIREVYTLMHLKERK